MLAEVVGAMRMTHSNDWPREHLPSPMLNEFGDLDCNEPLYWKGLVVGHCTKKPKRRGIWLALLIGHGPPRPHDPPHSMTWFS